MSMLPPAGWYPDPADDTNNRYWDGANWSDRVQPKSVPPPPSVAPAWGQGPPPPAAPISPYGYGPMPQVATAGVGRVGPDGQVLSGWWRRAGGYLLDLLIMTIPTVIAGAIAAAVVLNGGGQLFYEDRLQEIGDAVVAGETVATSELMSVLAPGFWTVFAVTVAVGLLASLLNGVYLVSRTGQTLGDRAVSVRKVMQGRTVPTFGVAFVRWVIPQAYSLIPFTLLSALVTLADYLWPLWDARSQTLHDKIARTYVERADLAGPPIPRR